MKSWMVLALVPLVAVGCGLVEPKDTDVVGNQPPETILTASPLEGTVNTYLAPISWRGEDTDGVVLGYYVDLDGNEWYTTSNDSAFTFESTSGSGDSLSDQHTLRVAAVDDDGDRDPTPDSVTFNSYTYLPETFIAGVDSGAEVGQAVQLQLSGTDPDDYIFTYVWAIDDTSTWTPVDTSIVIFADPTLVTAVPGYGDYVSAPLAPGAHTFYAKARDRALAFDPSAAALDFTVLEGTEPETEVFGGMVGEEQMFVDGSAYSSFTGQNRAELWVRADASGYSGRVHSLLYTLDGVASTWQTTNTPDSTALTLLGVSSGGHAVSVKARDTAGNEDSSPAELDLELVFPDLSAGLVVVHETVDGSGVPTSPTAQEVDDFYQAVLGGAQFTVEYWDTLGEITPRQAGNASGILWHSDDYRSYGESHLGTGARFLGQYLDCAETYGLSEKPALLVSAFNLLWSFAAETAGDTLVFAEGDFPYDYWGVQGGITVGTAKELYQALLDPAYAGTGYPDTIGVDASKLLGSWAGKLGYVWVMTPLAADVEVLYRFGSEDGTSEFEGLPLAVVRETEDFYCIVLGFPLYFMDEGSVATFVAKALDDLGL